MKAVLIILVLLALLIGSLLVYRNLSENASGPGDSSRMEAIDRARKASEQIKTIQDEVKRKAEDAAR